MFEPTGVGKSTGVSLLLNEILNARLSLWVFLLDVHNEYGRCFGDKAVVFNPRNMKLPFWLFNFGRNSSTSSSAVVSASPRS